MSHKTEEIDEDTEWAWGDFEELATKKSAGQPSFRNDDSDTWAGGGGKETEEKKLMNEVILGSILSREWVTSCRERFYLKTIPSLLVTFR